MPKRKHFFFRVGAWTVVLMTLALASSGCCRIRRGWLIRLNVALEWNRVPWRTGPAEKFEQHPPDCVCCRGLHRSGCGLGKCIPPGWTVESEAASGPQLLPVPTTLEPVPVEEEASTSAPASPKPEQSQSSSPAKPTEPLPEPSKRSAWYGPSLPGSWVFRSAQSSGLTDRLVRLDSQGRTVR